MCVAMLTCVSIAQEYNTLNSSCTSVCVIPGVMGGRGGKEYPSGWSPGVPARLCARAAGALASPQTLLPSHSQPATHLRQGQ